MDSSGRLPWYKSDGFIYGTVGATAGLAVIVVLLLVIWQCCSANRTTVPAAAPNYVMPMGFAEQVLRRHSTMSGMSLGRPGAGGGLYPPPGQLVMAARASGLMLAPSLMGPQQCQPYGAPPMLPPNMWAYQAPGQSQGQGQGQGQGRGW